MSGDGRNRRIVVGVDGSPLSRDALRWAAQEAEVRDCALDVVYGWQVSTEPRPDGVPLGVAPSAEQYEQAAADRIRGVVEEELTPEQAGRATVHIVHKPVGKALVAHARGADLLVIGSRTQGRLSSWLLGSVSTSTVQNAPCAVALIRAGCMPAEPPEGAGADEDDREVTLQVDPAAAAAATPDRGQPPG